MVYLKSFILALGSLFLPVKPLLLLVGLFICSDTVLGIWAAHKRGEKINSRKLGNIIPKIILYQAAVLIGYVLDVLLLGEFVNYFINIPMFITKIIAMILIFVEALSINENFENITGKNLFNSAKQLITRGINIKKDISKFRDDETS